MSWFDKLKSGLKKTSSKISSGIDHIFARNKLDEETSEELEELLITADIGVETAKFLIQELAKQTRFAGEASANDIKIALSKLIADILVPLAGKELSFSEKPKILIICGVNGNGKTTSVAKLANFYKNQGKSLLLAACDTFRAAAVDQLSVWAKRLQIPLITGAENADPASVAYKAVSHAIENNIDLLLLDTAGRLHNKEHLMAELAKIIRIVQKVDNNLTPEIILVLDATTGQNALIQLEKFKDIAKIDGLIITKLDGTAKGGIIVPIARKYQIPIIALGMGEGIEDLQPFSAENFANALLSNNLH